MSNLDIVKLLFLIFLVFIVDLPFMSISTRAQNLNGHIHVNSDESGIVQSRVTLWRKIYQANRTNVCSWLTYSKEVSHTVKLRKISQMFELFE